jgi:hypothetical protein
MESTGGRPSPFAGKATKYGDGCCVLRIRDALASVVEAAERNIEVKGRPDCIARKPGFPRDLMAKDFQSKVLDLARELCGPG